MCNQQGMSIICMWVAAHVGRWGHEEVDKIAKEALQRNTIDLPLKSPIKQEWIKGCKERVVPPLLHIYVFFSPLFCYGVCTM